MPNQYYKLKILDGLEALRAVNHNSAFPFHSHDSYTLTLTLNGTENIVLKDCSLFSPSGSISILNPFEVHSNPSLSKNGLSFFTFYISPDIVKFCNNDQPAYFSKCVINNPDLFRILYSLSILSTNPQSKFEHSFISILQVIIKKYSFIFQNESNEKNRIVKEFQSLIDENLNTKFNLNDLSKKVGLDKFKFLRLFKLMTGLTPNNYLILKRVEKSKLYLNKTDDLLDIALECGFYDTAHFYRHFKRFVGVTPLQYRIA